MNRILILINDAPYGTEKAYNALRLANQLGKEHNTTEVHIFLMADAVSCANRNQITPNGYYNIRKMLQYSLLKGAKVKICGSCAAARGLTKEQLIEGVQVSNMAEFTNWVVSVNKVLTF